LSKFKIINLPTFADARGKLTVLEGVLPFEIIRVYWIYGAEDELRAGHRHKVTRQAMVCLTGSVEVYMNDGAHDATIVLDNPTRCLLIEPEDWHTMRMGQGAVVMVVASHAYDRADYIEIPYD
jgi:hypothetical protein